MMDHLQRTLAAVDQIIEGAQQQQPKKKETTLERRRGKVSTWNDNYSLIPTKWGSKGTKNTTTAVCMCEDDCAMMRLSLCSCTGVFSQSKAISS
jgi:hypothetical protein